MSDQTNQNSTSSYLLTLGVITVSMSHLSSLHPLVAGLGTFLVLMNLMALVALSRDPQTTALLCGVAAMLGTAACWFCGSDLSVSIVIGASAIGTC